MKKGLFTDFQILKQPKGKNWAVLNFIDQQGESLMIALKWNCPMVRDIELTKKEKILKWFNTKGFRKWVESMKF